MVQDNNQPASQAEPAKSLGVPSTQGSRIEHGYTVRKMRELPVYEHELDQLSLLNSLTSGFLSACSASFFFTAGLFAQAKVQTELSPQALGFLYAGVPIGLLLSAGFLMAAIFAWKEKHSKLSEMKKLAVDIPELLSSTQQIAPSAPGTADSQQQAIG